MDALGTIPDLFQRDGFIDFADRRGRHLPDAILSVVAAMLGLGIVMGFSTAASLDGRTLLTPTTWWSHPAVRQTVFATLAFAVAVGIGRMDYRRLLGPSGMILARPIALLIISLVLCCAVWMPGIGIMRNGAQRWLAVGPRSLGLTVQPSEFLKPALVLFIAAAAVRRRSQITRFGARLLPLAAVISVCVMIVGIEDFGTAALLAVAGAGVLWAAGARRRHLLACGLPGVAGLGLLIWLRPFRVQRLLTFLDIWEDPQGTGYHAVQSLLAIASGGWWGRGLGASVQKYGYLPASSTDFVFSIICEELGFAGAAGVILLFVLLTILGIAAMRRAGNEFGRLIAFGAALIIVAQSAINIGVATVSLPTKGIALPFVSAGGSSAIIMGVLAGLLVSVSRHGARARE
ncbi:MAG: putative peptidoglycan glycosyltransferase FtsW [Phycisphaerae bacterium]